MPSQVLTSVENSFTKGLVTEFTGMNFPEDAATDCDNVEFTLVGDVLRRLGMNYETNAIKQFIDRTGNAINSYKWNNVGDGTTQLVALQVGNTIYFYSVTAATVASPLSNNLLVSTVYLPSFTATGGTFDITLACEFTEGNGYLFVFHQSCDPIYCTYSAGTITGNAINVQIRDFTGITEAGVPDDNRPSVLSDSHKYNLQNQGWSSGAPWSLVSSTNIAISTGAKSFTVPAGVVGINIGQYILMQARITAGGTTSNATLWIYGFVTSYVGTTLNVNIPAVGYITNPGGFTTWGGTVGVTFRDWIITPFGVAYIDTWFSAVGNYPSNSDQWWRFKDTSGSFNPALTINNKSLGLGSAPKGHYILSAFNQQRDQASGILTVTDITTLKRPTNGAWFQGRIWYTGVNALQAATGTAPFTTWSSNIYFSQIVQKPEDFGKCYQTNDPTSELLNGLLPTDGGIITIPESGNIYRLFPIQNGMLVFAANGIWFITGSQGIGFAATDYTITKISNIQSISTTSFVNVMGLPYFWNEEGIYHVKPAQQGGLEVEPITVGTILSFYNEIPLESKKYARAAYHPIDYVIQWVYRSTNSTSVTELYQFDKILNFNVYNKAFFPYTISTTSGYISSILYIAGPGGSTTLPPAFKYFAGLGTQTAFAELNDDAYEDWNADDFVSYFITGYKLHGQAQRKIQIPYIYVYSRTEGDPHSFKLQSRWDYASSGSGGRWSSQQVMYLDNPYVTTEMRRIRLRGQGYVLQFKFTSVTGQPFDIIGWSVYETQNTGV